MKIFFNILIILSLSSCMTSPYSARGIPDIPGVTADDISIDSANLTLLPEFSRDCQYQRDALLLKAASVALENGSNHFEFSNDVSSKLKFYKDCDLRKSTIRVYFCRGACPLYYSADAISHVIVRKFAKARWSSTRCSQSNLEACQYDVQEQRANWISYLSPGLW